MLAINTGNNFGKLQGKNVEPLTLTPHIGIFTVFKAIRELQQKEIKKLRYSEILRTLYIYYCVHLLIYIYQTELVQIKKNSMNLKNIIFNIGHKRTSFCNCTKSICII